MPSFFTEEEASESRLGSQALAFAGHTATALLAWIALMAVGYALNPIGVPHLAILCASLLFSLLVGMVVVKLWRSEMATAVWLLGLIWFLIVALYILDMPTGPNQCNQCDAAEKLTRSLFSYPRPSGLLDDDAPFLATWPAFALLGYSIGARLSLGKK